MPLESSRNQEQAIFFRARALAPAERDAFLQGACAGEPEMRQRLEARLKAEAIPLPLQGQQPALGPDGTLIIETSPLKNQNSARSKAGDACAAAERSRHDPFLPGARILGRYRIVSLVGQGGMGEVYRADDLKLGHPVALKFLPPCLDSNSPLLHFFLNEVRLSRQIAHPNVCRVHDLGESGDRHFLSMEYIDGEDLRSLLRRIGRLPVDKGIEVAQQLCAGLAAAHDQGVLHRDLKPANIMIDGQGRARITDFGLACLVSGTGAGELAGTPAYMAPEQWLKGESTIQSDLYSLGLVLFELFTGQPAFRGQSIPELQASREQMPACPSALVPGLHPDVERVILWCLQQDPRQRPRSARAVGAALPGADPLAAALAAGETPSPELVAASGGEGLLRNNLALVGLGGVIAGLVLAVWLSQWTYRVNHAGINKHPQAMVAEARRIIEKLGYSETPADWAYGYGTTERGESSMNFWYRQSPRPLINFVFHTGLNHLNYGEVDGSNPPWQVPGEVGLNLSPRGDLLRFRVVPPAFLPDAMSSQPEPKWTQWFPEALVGFDLEKLQRTTGAVPRPPDSYDQVRVWRGLGPGTNVFYAEAAAFGGRPVYFEVFDASNSAPLPSSKGAFGGPIASWIYLGLVASAAVLAYRNFRLHRSDRRGAFRVACYFFVLGLLIAAIQSHHSASEAESGVFEMGLAQAALRAMVFWLWYTALEPHVRRLWPETLISWTRLLEGRWCDPRVGRDLLVGCLFGLALNLVRQLHLLSPKSLGLPMRQFSNSPGWTLQGAGGLFADCLFKQIDAVFIAMFLLMTLLLLGFILRNRLVAVVACVLTFTAVALWPGVASAGIDWAVQALIVTLASWALLQWGFLTLVVLLLVNSLLTFPLTTDFSMWYASHGFTGAGLVLAMALFAFYTSRRVCGVRTTYFK